MALQHEPKKPFIVEVFIPTEENEECEKYAVLVDPATMPTVAHFKNKIKYLFNKPTDLNIQCFYGDAILPDLESTDILYMSQTLRARFSSAVHQETTQQPFSPTTVPTSNVVSANNEIDRSNSKPKRTPRTPVFLLGSFLETLRKSNNETIPEANGELSHNNGEELSTESFSETGTPMEKTDESFTAPQQRKRVRVRRHKRKKELVPEYHTSTPPNASYPNRNDDHNPIPKHFRFLQDEEEPEIIETVVTENKQDEILVKSEQSPAKPDFFQQLFSLNKMGSPPVFVSKGE